MNWETMTNMEHLREVCAEQGAVLKYGERVFAAALTTSGFEAAVYEFIETEEETGLSYVECRLNLRTTAPMPFDDNGDAIKWCFDHLND
ncbi:MAG TPA: hypothetical protein P5092_14420 [Ruminococcus sp.]|nr:hypothetical protein [Ruminococcus sp.]